MSTSIKLRRSSVPGKIPTAEQLGLGEVAINTHDGKMFFKRDANGAISIVEVGNRDISENVLYVSKSGSDDNSGATIAEAFLTIDSAIAAANTGTTIFVKSGDYTVNNPVTIPAGVAIVGDNLRTTNISPQTANTDIFYVNNSVYVTGVTFRDHTDGAAAVAFDPTGTPATNVITTSPYIQNCSSITTTGVGMKIDGAVVGGLRSMVSDAFTQINAGGKGIYILNQGYAQLVSIFTVACDIGVLAESGGQCSLTNSNCSFGNIGLKATGVSDVLYSGTVDADAERFSNSITVNNLSERPKYGDAILFSSSNTYYTVANSTELSSNTSTITLEEDLDQLIPSGDTASFYQRSLIAASSITFEYVGTGTDLYNTPRSGAFPDQTKEVIFDDDNGGLVFFTSTDHKGDFRIGSDLVINRESGTITGVTFDRSLFSVLTPYILALED
jgi:hypothetical protein